MVKAQCWREVAGGQHFTLAIKEDGTLWAWGSSYYGQLGLGNYVLQTKPQQVGTDTTWKHIAAGSAHSMAIKTDGTLWIWGDNDSGQLGLGDFSDRNTPHQVGTDTTWQSIDAGNVHSMALKTDGTLWIWGANFYGQLGLGHDRDVTTPTQFGTDNNWKSIAAGAGHSLAIKTDGRLWAWGRNEGGQLGLNSIFDEANTPTQVGIDSTWKSISAGGHHTIALKTNGTLWAWGSSFYGQLGLGHNDNIGIVTQVGTDTTWKSIATGSYHSMALKTDGTLWTWGSGGNGVLCSGYSSSQNMPKRVGTDKTWKSISAGNNQSVALKTNNTLWICGSNEFGQLGLGFTSYVNALTLLDCPALGDACVTATDIQHLFGKAINIAQVSNPYDNTNATITSGDPTFDLACFSSNDTLKHTVWFTFIGDDNAYQIRSVKGASTNYIKNGDTQVALFSGDCASPTFLLCDDNEYPKDAQLNFSVQISTVAGTRYRLMVDGYDNHQGQFCLEVTNLGAGTVTEVAHTDIRLFPNPTTGILQLSNMHPEQVLIYNRIGQLMQRLHQPGGNIDLSGLPAGMYFLQVTERGQVQVLRAVKE
jgi:alpha-tubulin suppressor-like RCC1 family protein